MVIAPEATFKAVPSVINFTLVTVPVLVVYPAPLVSWLLLVILLLRVIVVLPDWFAVNVPDPLSPVPPVTVNVPLPTDGSEAEVI